MNILFATGGLAMPQMFGGSQRSSDAIIKGLIARGHDVRLASALAGGDRTGLSARIRMKLRGKTYAVDNRIGYPCYRGWDMAASLPAIVSDWRPDAAVVLAQKPVPVARALQQAGVPVLLAIQDNEFGSLGGDLRELGAVDAVANSQFTASRFAEAFGLQSCVIHPIIDADTYRVPTTGDRITFINPDPRKGYEVFLRVAKARPNYSFLVVESWPLTKEDFARIKAELDVLPNVEFLRATPDIRTVYARTRIMFAPSQWEEGYGRIATEAQINGIPVIGSDKGGLPEAIGPGGLVLPAAAPEEAWSEALDRVMGNADFSARLSEAALAHAGRPEMVASWQIGEWERQIALTTGRNGRAQ